MEQKKYSNLFNKNKFFISKYQKLFFQQGKKEKIELMLKILFSFLKKQQKNSPLFLFLGFFFKARPFCEVKSLKIKGKLMRTPIEIKKLRQQNLVLNWLIKSSCSQKNQATIVNLSKEIIVTKNFQSQTVKCCDEMHRMAESNKTSIN